MKIIDYYKKESSEMFEYNGREEGVIKLYVR